MFRKFFAFFLSVIIIVACVTTSAYATNEVNFVENEYSTTWTLATFSSGEEYLYNEDNDEKIIKVFGYSEKGELMEIDLEEYMQIINSMPRISINNEHSSAVTEFELDRNFPQHVWVDYFQETSTYVGLGNSHKVTADLEGPGTISHFNSKIIENSFGGEIGVTAKIKTAIELGASFNWYKSLSSENSNGYSYNVPVGYTGYIQFTPYLNVTIGDLYSVYAIPDIYEDIYLGEMWGACPKEIAGGFADGLFQLILK